MDGGPAYPTGVPEIAILRAGCVLTEPDNAAANALDRDAVDAKEVIQWTLSYAGD